MTRDDISIGVPAGWRKAADPALGIVVAARSARVPASGFAPTVVLDAEPVDTALHVWQDQAGAHLATLLDDYDEEDCDAYVLGDEAVRYRRASFRSGEHDLVCEQWCWLVGGIGFTLTGSVAREDYADYTDLFEDIAATFNVRNPT